MLRNTFLAVLIVSVVAATAQATVMITSTSVDTPNLPGFKTWTVTATSTDPITAIDFVGDGSNDPATGKGFFGPLNQVTIPVQTIFNDNNALISVLAPGKVPEQDSQFTVNSTTVVVPPGLAEETGNVLQAAWAWSTPQGLTLPVAQLVIPTAPAATVRYQGAITALVAGVQTDFPVQGTIGEGGPTVMPPVVADANLGNRIRGAVLNYQYTTTQGDAPITWGNLVRTGPTPAIAPTLSAAGAFMWDTAGSPFGTYNFDATADNTAAGAGGGTDVGRLTINLIPEPATMSLIGLAIVGLVGLIRKR